MPPTGACRNGNFAFADTIHSSMGQAHGSVHLLASTGMSVPGMGTGLEVKVLYGGELVATVSPKATARSLIRRETVQLFRREVVWGGSRRQTAAPNESELH